MKKHSIRLQLFLIGMLALTPASSRSFAETGPSTVTDDQRFQLPETDEGLPGAGPIRRADWFKKLWAERRAAFASRVQQDQNALVFLGDSIT